MLSIEEIKRILKENYGEITDSGCYVNGQWLSLERVIELLEREA